MLRTLPALPRRDGGAIGAEDYGRFTRELSADELAGCFFLTDDERHRIASRRGDAGRFGFAVQLGTVRYLGGFLENPAAVPASVVRWTAGELGTGADTDLEQYGAGEARGEHQAEPRLAYGYRPFGDEGVEDKLVLADAVGAMARLARSPDDRARELVLSRYRGVAAKTGFIDAFTNDQEPGAARRSAHQPVRGACHVTKSRACAR